MTSSSAIGYPEVYLPVNWADGMKINKDHFRAEQQAGSWQLSRHSASALNATNYGLFTTGEPQHIKPVVITTDNQQQVSIRLLACQAITRGGHLIHVQESAATQEQLTPAAIPGLSVPYSVLSAADADYYVMLTVNPYHRVPTGAPDMEESQLRPPYTAPGYQLQLVNCRDNNRETAGEYYLPLGRIRVSEGRVLPDEDYIPPCTSTIAHPALSEWHAGLEQFFGSMESYVLRIQQKIVQKNQQNELAFVVGDLCNTISPYLACEYQRVLMEYRYLPPIRMVAGAAALSRLLKNRLDIYTGPLKDELLNYFAEWCNIQQGEWEAVTTGLSNCRYDHRNIREALRQTDGFIHLMLRLFSSLAALEYIGKKREAGIFVKEHLVVPAEEMPAPRRKSFLAE
jgi:hypothetical protein